MLSRQRLNLLVAVVVAAVISTNGPTGAQAQANRGDSLVGSWFIEVTPDEQVPPPFRMLMTFSSDGTLVETQNDALVPPFFITPGHGVWRRAGKNKYSLKMLQLTFDSAGSFTGKLVLTATATVGDDEDRVSMVMQVKVQDPAGNLIFSTSGAAQGTRILLDRGDQ